PVQYALSPDVDVAYEEDRKERQDLEEPGPPEAAQRQRPRVEERDLDVEEQKDHRHQVELHRVSFTRVADGGHAALVRGELLRGGILRAEQDREANHDPGEPDAEGDHDDYAKPAVHLVVHPRKVGERDAARVTRSAR